MLGAFQWTPHNWRAPDAILLQTACCYEQRGTGSIFEENRKSLFTVLDKRRIGVSGKIESSQGFVLENVNITITPVAGTRGIVKNLVTGPTGFFFQSLDEGMYSISVSSEGYTEQHLEFTVANSNLPSVNFVLHKPFNLSGGRLFLTFVFSFVMLSIVFYSLYNSFKSWAFSSKHGGFERVPLNDIDFGDESDDDILDFRQIKN